MQLRPSFRYRCSGTAAEGLARLQSAMQEDEATCRGKIREGKLELIVDDPHPHFWAPELRARIYDEEGDLVVKGYFAPKPDTWTMFLAIYAATVFSTGVGTVFGFAQWQLGHSAWALWSLPVGLFAVACVWLGARLGHELGSEDMQTLRSFVEENVGSVGE